MAVRNVVQLQQPKNSFCQHVLNLHQGPRQPVGLAEQQRHWGAALRARTAGTATASAQLNLWTPQVINNGQQLQLMFKPALLS